MSSGSDGGTGPTRRRPGDESTEEARVRFRAVSDDARAHPTVGRGGPGPTGALRIVGAVLVHPTLWPVALRQAARASRPHWWRRAPFLPVPDADYLRFRLETQYGTGGVPDPDDVVVYLRWCRDHDR